MTVAELIAKLQELPQDAVVLVRDAYSSYTTTLSKESTHSVHTLVLPYFDNGKSVTDPNDPDGLVRGKFIYL